VHVQRLVSVVKMVPMLEVCATKEQHSVLWAKGLIAKIYIKKCFLFMVGSVCHIKQFTTGSRNSLEGVSKVTNDVRPGAEVAETTVKRLLWCRF
jgi:hypothetical protein